MKLCYNSYQLEIDLIENIINVVVLENQNVFTKLVQEMWVQCEGGIGGWTLLEKNKQLSFTKNVICIINPFSIDLNEKRIITRLYSELSMLTKESMIEQSNKLNKSIVQYLDDVSALVNYPVVFNADFNLSNLLKLYDMKLDCNFDTFLEKIVEYIKEMHQICDVTLYVFVGLKQYLNTEELSSLYEFAFYEKIQLLLIEGRQDNLLLGEKLSIIDQDLCIIESE